MQQEVRKIKNLFLRQSYLDAWEDYETSLVKKSFPKWDYCILTASNEEQAKAYHTQIEYRIANHCLPVETKYVVLPDPDGKRVGSGGASFNVIRYIAEDSGNEAGCFSGKRILVIHSGGDSKRIPQYSACGKLFSPVPRELPNGKPSTLFDEFIISMSGMPSRMKEGMMTLSGDVLLLFNALQIDYQFKGAAAISIKENVMTGKDHGVFRNDGNGVVDAFLHKLSVEQLTKAGAVNETGDVDIDTGAIVFDSVILERLYSLISTDGKVDEDKFAEFVNEEARISFYGDFLYPLAKSATLEEYYEEAPEGTMCDALLSCRKKIWDVLHDINMSLISLAPAEFIHFGTTRELLELVDEQIGDYEFLNWLRCVCTNVSTNDYAVNNGLITNSEIGKGCYIENAYVTNSVIGDGSIISQIQVEDITVPEHVVLHGLKLSDESYMARIYGVKDNPKGTLGDEVSFLGIQLSFMCDRYKLREVLWDAGKAEYLWTAKLYPSAGSWKEACKWALLLYQMSTGAASDEEVDVWASKKRYSLESGYNAADVTNIVCWNQDMENRILVEKYLTAIVNDADAQEARKIFGKEGIGEKRFFLLMQKAEEADSSVKIRIYYNLSLYLSQEDQSFGEISSEVLEEKCFAAIRNSIYENAAKKVAYLPERRIQKDIVSVQLPVRVNWGGGWTDTPPHCMEQGGVVLNAAITLRGELPIRIVVKKLEELKVVFESIDAGVKEEFTELSALQDCHDPFDMVALHKAALIACGLIPAVINTEGKEAGNINGSLQEILKQIGGGVYLSTEVVNIPRGSGLGTSSILAGACMKGLFEFFGEEKSEDDLYQSVLSMEQIMSTGGGWQDQVGGLTSGIKLITTKPGIDQIIKVEKLELTEQAMQELSKRFVLIYTGQRRLARNLLRDVVGNYLAGRKESLYALEEMKKLAVLMKLELEQGDVDGFARLLNEHWKLSKMLDEGSTNTCIEQIFLCCEDLIDGRFIAGAGGGGFLQVILKKNVTKDQLHERLYSVFQSSGVDVWECEIVRDMD